MTLLRRRFISVYGEFDPGDVVSFDGEKFVAAPPTVSPEDVAAAIDPDELAAALAGIVAIPADWSIGGTEVLFGPDQNSYLEMGAAADGLWLQNEGASGYVDISNTGDGGAARVQVRAQVGQADPMLRLFDENGVTILEFQPDGDLYLRAPDASANVNVYASPNTAEADFNGPGDAHVYVQALADQAGVEVQAQTGQTVGLLRLLDENGVEQLSVTQGAGGGRADVLVGAVAGPTSVVQGITGDWASVGVWGASPGGEYAQLYTDSTLTQIMAQAKTGQADPLLRLYDDGGDTIFAVSPGGGLLLEEGAVPTDGVSTALRTRTITFSFGGGAEAGDTAFVMVPVGGYVTGWTILGDGNAVVDIWKDVAPNNLPTDADRIAGTDKPTLSGDTVSSSTDLTGWSVNIAAGDIVAAEVESIAGTWVTVELTMVLS